MPTAVLSEDEKNRIRHHLGYLITSPVSSIQLGVPRASQPMFLVETAMNSIPEAAVGQVRKYVAVLDGLEDRLIEAVERFAASRLGDIDLRDNETDMIEKEYARWAKRLADDLGVPLNAYSERFRFAGGVPMNLPVTH